MEGLSILLSPLTQTQEACHRHAVITDRSNYLKRKVLACRNICFSREAVLQPSIHGTCGSGDLTGYMRVQPQKRDSSRKGDVCA